MTLWAHEERMVRTAVRTIVLSICRVDDAQVRAFVSRSPMLPRQVNSSLRTDCAFLLTSITDASHGTLPIATEPTADAPAAAPPGAAVASASIGGAVGASPSGSQLGAMEGRLQLLLDDVYFVNDLLETGVEPLGDRMLHAILSQFLMPTAIQPLADGGRREQLGAPAAVVAVGDAASIDSVVRAAADDGLLSWEHGAELLEPLPKLISLLVLAHCLHVFTEPALLSSIATLLLHPRLRLSDVKLSKLDLLQSAALDRARSACESSLSLSRESTRAEIDFDVDETSAGGGSTGTGGGGAGGVTMPIADDGPDCNALRAAVLGLLRSTDERYVLLSCCVLLSAVRCTCPARATAAAATAPPGHTELLKQARLLPLRQLRSESLLAQLLRTRSEGKGGALAAGLQNARADDQGSSLVLAAGKAPTESGGRRAPAEYSEGVVTRLIALLGRAASQYPTPSADSAAARGTPRARGMVRLVTVQAAVELLLELVHDSSPSVNLSAEHAAALEAAHSRSASGLQRALQGRFAASLGNLVEYVA